MQGQEFYRQLAAYYDELFPVDTKSVEFLRQRAGSGVRVLDAASGTGAHALALKREGIDVYGVDNSPEMVEVAKQKEPSHFAEMDMRSVDRHAKRPFSLVYCIGNSVSHLPFPGDGASFLGALFNALQPEGRGVVQIIDVSDLDAGTVYPLPTLTGLGCRMERSYTVDGVTDDGVTTLRFDAELHLESEGRRKSISQRLLALSPFSLETMAREAGFPTVTVTSGFTDRPYSSGESRIAVVEARR